MALKELLVNALTPYKGKMNTWNDSDIELLFMGFGNISIFMEDSLIHKAEDLSGTFKENAIAINEALEELGLHNNKWTYKDFYWLIDNNAGEPREDLIQAIQNCGVVCYDFFDSEEMVDPLPIKTFKEDPMLS